MHNNLYDVIIIGGGPAGLASAISCKEKGLNTLIIERESKLGGILKQCIHDGFGLTRYKERLTGPEYAYKDIKKVHDLNIDVLLSTFVLDIKKDNNIFNLTLTSKEGITYLKSKTIILAMGCRERTARQILIHGTKPSGVFTAGTAQNLVNLEGLLPCKNAVILGSGDIGLIMARRLTLEGCNVLGVYEAKPTPSGLARNISQCLNDFNIPLYLSKTVTKVIGDSRVEAVEVASVDEHFNPIKGTEEIIKCDSLILSVGLIPENELSEKLGVKLSSDTKGPLVDNNLMTNIDGVFAVGNCLSVNDLVDYVSENGFTAGRSVYNYLNKHNDSNFINVIKESNIGTIVPQTLDLSNLNESTIFYIRSNKDLKDVHLIIKDNELVLLDKPLKVVHQAESLRVEVKLNNNITNLKVSLI